MGGLGNVRHWSQPGAVGVLQRILHDDHELGVTISLSQQPFLRYNACIHASEQGGCFGLRLLLVNLQSYQSSFLGGTLVSSLGTESKANDIEPLQFALTPELYQFRVES